MKKLISLLLTSLFVFAAVCGVFAAERKNGDVNGDGAVNNKDVVSLFRFVNGDGKAADEEYCDVNGDGNINNKDVVALFKAVSGEGEPHIHKFTTAYTEIQPTCTEEGLMIRTCGECGYKESESLPAFGHNYVQTGETAATCLQKATRTEICSRCGDEKTYEYGELGAHTLITETVKEPTDDEEGLQRDRCTVCGWTGNEQTVCNHNWVRYVITKEDSQRAEDARLYGKTSFEMPWGTITTLDGSHRDGYIETSPGWACYYCSKCLQIDMSVNEYGKNQKDAAEEMLEYVNALRSEYYVQKMVLSDYLCAIAQQRAIEIQSNYSHDGSLTQGENLTSGCATIYGAFLSFYDSIGHRKTMINAQYTYFGCGYAPAPLSKTTPWFHSLFVIQTFSS